VTGTERAWESYLRGTRGWEKVLVDARGRRRQGGDAIIGSEARVDPIPGRDLRLTLDAELQVGIDKAFRGELAGGVAVIEVKTGRILGLYSKPSFDPNALSGASGKQVIRDAFRRLYTDPLKPALDKTVSGAYPPGSTFKPFTAIAGLDKGLIDQRASIQCRGFIKFGRRTYGCTHVHGATSLHKAIAESCNVYFWQLVSEYQVGMDVIAETGQRFGFGAKTGLGINAEASGRMPTRAWMTYRNKGRYLQGFALNAAIGQGATTVTVLQLGLAYAALANGGTLYQPQLVRAVETSNGTVVQEFSPRVRRQIPLDADNLKLVQKALKAGAQEERGTAFRARIAGVDLAGKTGTAQVGHRLVRGVEAERVWYFNRDHAWFAGYSPSNAPEVAIVVLVEHGGAGGKHAAPDRVQGHPHLQRARGEARRRRWRCAPACARPRGAPLMRGNDALSARFDWPLFVGAVLIALLGVLNLYSATSVYTGPVAERYISQLYWLLGAGVVGALICAFDYRHIERFAYIIYGIGVFTLVVVLVLARDVRGSARWIEFGAFRFQPSEFTKLCLIVALAKYLHDDPKNEGRTLKDLLVPALITAVPAFLVLRQPDLGTASVHVFIFLTIAAVTKLHTKSILAFLGTVMVGIPLLYKYGLRDYQRNRVDVFLNPEADVLGKGWHAYQARVAIGNGGFSRQRLPPGAAEPVPLPARPVHRLSLPGVRRGVGLRGQRRLDRALRVPLPVVGAHRVPGQRPFRRRAVRRRDGDALLARGHQRLDDLRAHARRRRHAPAVLVRRLERHQHHARPRAAHERLDASQRGETRALLSAGGASRRSALSERGEGRELREHERSERREDAGGSESLGEPALGRQIAPPPGEPEHEASREAPDVRRVVDHHARAGGVDREAEDQRVDEDLPEQSFVDRVLAAGHHPAEQPHRAEHGAARSRGERTSPTEDLRPHHAGDEREHAGEHEARQQAGRAKNALDDFAVAHEDPHVHPEVQQAEVHEHRREQPERLGERRLEAADERPSAQQVGRMPASEQRKPGAALHGHHELHGEDRSAERCDAEGGHGAPLRVPADERRARGRASLVTRAASPASGSLQRTQVAKAASLSAPQCLQRTSRGLELIRLG
jgi:beta-lactamase class D